MSDFQQSEGQAAHPSPPTANRCCSPRSWLKASPEKQPGRRGWAQKEARLCHPFPSLPWALVWPALTACLLPGHRLPPAPEGGWGWVQASSTVVRSPYSPRSNRSEHTHFHGNELPTHLPKCSCLVSGVPRASLHPLQYLKGDFPSDTCDQGDSGTSLYIRKNKQTNKTKKQKNTTKYNPDLTQRLNNGSESLTLIPILEDPEDEGWAFSRWWSKMVQSSPPDTLTPISAFKCDQETFILFFMGDVSVGRWATPGWV